MDEEEIYNCTMDGPRKIDCSDGYSYILEATTSDWWKILLESLASAFLVLFAGLMSGLTMGLMSLDMTNLKIIAKSGDPVAQKHAERIIPLVAKHHLLLVTLLIGNSLAMEALPIFLDRLVGPFFAVILAVTMVLFFGE
jgi:metal transporter CNNM